MQISDNLTVQPATGTSGPVLAQTRAWEVGQLLSATALGNLGPGQISLRIAGQSLTAQTRLAVEPGTTLTLRVVAAGEQPTLAVVSPAAESDPQLQAWRTALPLQEPLPPLLDAVVALAGGASTAEPPVSPAPAIAKIARQVLGGLADVQTVARPAGLKKAILDSGLFLEARLSAAAKGGDTTGITITDLKAGLLRLANALQETPTAPIPTAEAIAQEPPGATVQVPADTRPTAQAGDPAPAIGSPGQATHYSSSAASAARDSMVASSLQRATSASDPSPQNPIRQVEAALARLQMNQLSSLPTGSGEALIWAIDLPIRLEDRVDVLRLRVEGEDRRGHPKGSFAWSVSLDLEPNGLGSVQARLTLLDRQISANVWAERPQTAALFATHLDELRDGMTRAGLTIAAMGCYCGKAPQIGAGRMPEKLVDTRV